MNLTPHNLVVLLAIALAVVAFWRPIILPVAVILVAVAFLMK